MISMQKAFGLTDDPSSCPIVGVIAGTVGNGSSGLPFKFKLRSVIDELVHEARVSSVMDEATKS